MPLRAYRADMLVKNQNSPVEIYKLVLPQVLGPVVGDIGCGNGLHAYLLRTALSGREKFVFWGVDFSAKAVRELKKRRIYERVIRASSDRLPLPDKSVDTALCLENLEHLYADQVQAAIRELCRVARKRVVITTPWPGQAINREFLAGELAAALADEDALGAQEFGDLVGYAHKSVVLPGSMVAAGFENPLWKNSLAHFSALYVGDPSAILPERIVAAGLRSRAWPRKADHRADYCGLLKASLVEADKIPWSWRQWAVHLISAARQIVWAAKTLRAALRS